MKERWQLTGKERREALERQKERLLARWNKLVEGEEAKQ